MTTQATMATHNGTRRMGGPNSDNTVNDKARFTTPDPTKMVARGIRKVWNLSIGLDEIVLMESSGLNRKVVIDPAGSLFATIAHTDPEVLHMERDARARDLIPRMQLTVEMRNGQLVSTAFKPLTISHEETITQQRQATFDALHIYARDVLGMGRAEIERVIKDTYADHGIGDNVKAMAANALIAHYLELHPVKHVEVETVPETTSILAQAMPESYAAMIASQTDKPKWSAVNAVKLGAQEYSAKGHFLREIQKLDQTIHGGNVGKHVIKALLGKDIIASIQSIGVQATCDRLQAYLDNYKPQETTVTDEAQEAYLQSNSDQAEAEAKSKKISIKEWREFLAQHHFDGEYVLSVLHAYSMHHYNVPVTKLSEWNWSLDTALMAIAADTVLSAKQAPSSPAVAPAGIGTPENAVSSNVPPAELEQSASEKPIVTLPESPFSANFKLIDKHGIEVQFTIRAESGAAGVPKVDAAIEYLLAHEYTTNRPAPAHNGNGASVPAQDSAGGLATCVLISVGESYEGHKPQLNFECDGFDKPLRFTKATDSMVNLLKNVRKIDGTPFSSADLTNGRKFAGQWLVKWSQNDKYKNVESVSAA
jgi:hypothetical protein